MTTEIAKKESRPRKRRNYERELRDLQVYCEASIKSLEFIKANMQKLNIPADGIEAQSLVYADILARINGGK